MTGWIVAPVPQLHFPQRLKDFEFSKGFFLRHLDAQLRKTMFFAIRNSNGSEDARCVTLEAEMVAFAAIPKPWPVQSVVISGAFYRIVADAILRRLVDCLRLWDDVPDIFDHSCWFAVEGELDEINTETMQLTEPAWNCPAEYPKDVHLAATTLRKTSELRDILLHLQGIELLNKAFADNRKQTGYNKAGQANTVNEAKRLAKRILLDNPDSSPKIPKKYCARWFMEGYIKAFNRVLSASVKNLKFPPKY